MSAPTRFTHGVTTVAKETLMGSYPLPDDLHTARQAGFATSTYTNDFYTVASGDWTITGTSSTFTSTSGLGGISLVTPGGTTTVTTVARSVNQFQFVAGQRLWYQARLKASAVSGTKAFNFGLQNGTGATPTAAIQFRKAASSTSLDLISTVNSVTTVLVTGLTTVADDTYFDVGFYFTGYNLLVYLNNALVARIDGATIGSSGTTLTNAALAPAFQITPTATDTLSIDYVFTAQEVVR